jgi:hypothetical protein
MMFSIRKVQMKFFTNTASQLRGYRSHLSLLTVFFVSMALSQQFALALEPPYPPSRVIKSITWDFAKLRRAAPGSDLWPLTWADNGHLYTSWGDGGGFGGTNGDGRVSLGFARIEGPPTGFTATNVWGGKKPEYPATFTGKASGMLSVHGILYAWANAPQRPNVPMRLLWSVDRGAHWKQANWRFGQTDTLRDLSFLNFGKGYQGARDNFVYSYALERGGPSDPPNYFFKAIHLLRVPKTHTRMINRTAYQFFAGLDVKGNPVWTTNITQRKPVFTDANGVGLPSVSYNPGIQRYLLTVAHGKYADGIRKLGIFDAPQPWGPWTTVQYNEDWGGYTGFWLGYYLPTKTPDWMSRDGKTIHLVFSGQDKFDSFNLLKGTLILKTPPAPTDLQVGAVP